MTAQEIMEMWAAGDWDKEPDGGTCTAILLAWSEALELAKKVVVKTELECRETGDMDGATALSYVWGRLDALIPRKPVGDAPDVVANQCHCGASLPHVKGSDYEFCKERKP